MIRKELLEAIGHCRAANRKLPVALPVLMMEPRALGVSIATRRVTRPGDAGELASSARGRADRSRPRRAWRPRLPGVGVLTDTCRLVRRALAARRARDLQVPPLPTPTLLVATFGGFTLPLARAVVLLTAPPLTVIATSTFPEAPGAPGEPKMESPSVPRE